MSKMTVTSSSDLTYGNCIALNAPAILDEAHQWLNTKNKPEMDDYYEAMLWASTKATENQLHDIGQIVLQDDRLWDIWRASVLGSIYDYYVTEVTTKQVGNTENA